MLVEVFEISGRGTVVLVQIRDGCCLVGDSLVVGENQWPISGIEMIKYNAEGMQRLADGWVPLSGLLLQGATKSDLIGHIGTEVGTVEQRKPGE